LRFEIPARYRHFRDVAVRYARWNLGRVDLVDPRSVAILAPIYPVDKGANADGRRALIELEVTEVPPDWVGEGQRTRDELPETPAEL
jgi:putative transposase